MTIDEAIKKLRVINNDEMYEYEIDVMHKSLDRIESHIRTLVYHEGIMRELLELREKLDSRIRDVSTVMEDRKLFVDKKFASLSVQLGENLADELALEELIE